MLLKSVCSLFAEMASYGKCAVGLPLCGSRKNPYPPPPPKDNNWKFQGGGGSQKPKFLRESMKQNWKFQGGGRVQTKKPSLGEVWIFSGTTHLRTPVGRHPISGHVAWSHSQPHTSPIFFNKSFIRRNLSLVDNLFSHWRGVCLWGSTMQSFYVCIRVGTREKGFVEHWLLWVEVSVY